MPNMGKTNKRLVSNRLDVALCHRVEKKYSRPGDPNKSLAYARALEDAARDVQLTAQDYMSIAAEIHENELKRKRSV